VKREPVTYTLEYPVQFGSELVTQLVLTPSAGAFRGFKMVVDASQRVEMDPHAAAVVAVRMAGRPDVFADKLDPSDMLALGALAQSFFASGRQTQT
jgi:hypothetical protein